MSTLTTLQFDRTIIEGNLDALRVRQSRLVDRLRQVDFPGEACLVAGRDGQPAVALEVAAGRIEWLGGSSMTSVSPEAVLTDYADKGCNVILPSVGTGHEPAVLARRIRSHCAVFVYEPILFHIALALGVVNMSDLIGQGKIVFVDDPIDQTLPEFLSDHIGYDAPAQLFPLPGIDRPEMERRLAAIERVGPIVNGERIRRVEKLSTSIRKCPPDRRRGLLVLSIDTAGMVAEHASALLRASEAIELPLATCIPCGPDQCSHVARLAAVEEKKPSSIVFLNCTPGTLMDQLPPGVPWCSWFMECAQLPVDALQSLESCPQIMAASERVRDILVSQGAVTQNVNILEAGVDTTRFRPIDEEISRTVDVSVFADGDDLAPQAVGLGLETHQKLWAAATSLMAEQPDRFSVEQVTELLRLAEKRAGVHLTDESLRPSLLSLMSTRLVRTMAVRTALANVATIGASIQLWGRNWHKYDETRLLHKGEIPTSEHRNREYNRSKLVLVPFLDIEGIKIIWEAVAAGCMVLAPDCRKAAKNYPQTGSVLEMLPQFEGFNVVASSARTFLEDDRTLQHEAKSIRQTIVNKHSVANRLRSIVELLS